MLKHNHYQAERWLHPNNQPIIYTQKSKMVCDFFRISIDYMR